MGVFVREVDNEVKEEEEGVCEGEADFKVEIPRVLEAGGVSETLFPLWPL